MKVFRLDKGQILLNPVTKTPYAKNYYSGKCPCDGTDAERCYPCAICTFFDVACTDMMNVCHLVLGDAYDLPLTATYSDYSRWYDPSDINPEYIDDGSENDNSDWKSKYNTYWTREQILAGECTVSLDVLEPEREINRAQCCYAYKDAEMSLLVMLEVTTRNLKGLTVVNNTPAFFNWSLLTVQVSRWNDEKQKYVFERSYFVQQNSWTNKPYAFGNATKLAGRNLPFQLNNFDFSKHKNGTKISLHKDLTLETFDMDYVVMSIPAGDTFGSFRRYWNTEIKSGENAGQGCDDDWNESINVNFEYDESIKGNCWKGYSECDVNSYRESELGKPPVQPTDETNPDSPNNPSNNPAHGDESNPDSPANPENPDNPNNPNNPVNPDSPVNPNGPNYDPALDPTTPPAPPPAPGTLKYCVAAFYAVLGTDNEWIITGPSVACLAYEDIDFAADGKWMPSSTGSCTDSWVYMRVGASGCTDSGCSVDETLPSAAGLPVCYHYCVFTWTATCADGAWTVSGSTVACLLENEMNGIIFNAWTGSGNTRTYNHRGDRCVVTGDCSTSFSPEAPSDTCESDTIYVTTLGCWGEEVAYCVDCSLFPKNTPTALYKTSTNVYSAYINGYTVSVSLTESGWFLNFNGGSMGTGFYNSSQFGTYTGDCYGTTQTALVSEGNQYASLMNDLPEGLV